MVIKVSVFGQRIEVPRYTDVYSGSRNYIRCVFSLSPEWSDAVALFTRDGNTYAVPIVGGECVVPWEVIAEAGHFDISAFCGDRLTAGSARVTVRQSGYTSDVAESITPTPDVFAAYYSQTLEASGAAADSSGKAAASAEIAEASAERAADSAASAASSSGNASASAETSEASAERAASSAASAASSSGNASAFAESAAASAERAGAFAENVRALVGDAESFSAAISAVSAQAADLLSSLRSVNDNFGGVL